MAVHPDVTTYAMKNDACTKYIDYIEKRDLKDIEYPCKQILR